MFPTKFLCFFFFSFSLFYFYLFIALDCDNTFGYGTNCSLKKFSKELIKLDFPLN